MPECVVYLLEMVDVVQQHRQWPHIATSTGELALKSAHDMLAVENAGKKICRRQRIHLTEEAVLNGARANELEKYAPNQNQIAIAKYRLFDPL